MAFFQVLRGQIKKPARLRKVVLFSTSFSTFGMSEGQKTLSVSDMHQVSITISGMSARFMVHSASCCCLMSADEQLLCCRSLLAHAGMLCQHACISLQPGAVARVAWLTHARTEAALHCWAGASSRGQLCVRVDAAGIRSLAEPYLCQLFQLPICDCIHLAGISGRHCKASQAGPDALR